MVLAKNTNYDGKTDMRNVLLISLLFNVGVIWAQENDLTSLQMRMKQIEVRLSLIERDLSEMKQNKIPSVPIEQANLPSQQVLIWGSESIEHIYSYNYKNFPQVLTEIRNLFTQQGYDSYIKALNDSKNLQAVQDKRLYVTAKVSRKGKVVKEGVVNGIYTWEMQLPLEVTYKSSNESVVQKLLVNVEIVRVPSSESPVGIAIHSITATIEPTEEEKPAPASGAAGVGTAGAGTAGTPAGAPK